VHGAVSGALCSTLARMHYWRSTTLPVCLPIGDGDGRCRCFTPSLTQLGIEQNRIVDGNINELDHIKLPHTHSPPPPQQASQPQTVQTQL
jgi:hypothetical protein